jgi:hypothetical protein
VWDIRCHENGAQEGPEFRAIPFAQQRQVKILAPRGIKLGFCLIRDALRLDIFDLSFRWSSEALGILHLSFVDTARKGLLVRFSAFLYHTIKSVGMHLRGRAERCDRGGILLFVTSKNQRDSLLGLRTAIPNAYLGGCYTEVDRSFPLLKSHIISIPFFPVVAFRYWRASQYERLSFRYNLDNYWLSYGAFIACCSWLAKLTPRAVILSNDHNPLNRIAAKCARRHNIPTIYLQHASVTAKFPPLDFDYALLEGRDAARKYDEAGPAQTRVLLVGMPKFDEYTRCVNQNERILSLGICTNEMDPIEEVSMLCTELRRECPQLRLVLRPHPGDIRSLDWQALASLHHMEFSDSRCVGAFGFLRTVDAIVAAESSIHLEAVLLNVYPLYYAYSGQALDWYGYGVNQLHDCCSSRDDVLEKVRRLMREKPYVRNRARLYCETVDTTYDGKSSDLIRSEVERIALAVSDQRVKWVQDLSYQHLNVYVPAEPTASIGR